MKIFCSLWNKRRSGLCRKSNESEAYIFIKPMASRNAMEVKTLLLQKPVKKFATDRMNEF
ncbi:MAG: hypothetical protein JWP81_599 [Ferruginibacter sp.]|nr:hypothetical protein [Ferruginibacter sp.]